MSMALGSKPVAPNQSRRKPAPLAYFLGVVFVLFIGILVFCYVVTKRTNPVFLDEHGKPVSAETGHH
jgi:hypothetical protein